MRTPIAALACAALLLAGCQTLFGDKNEPQTTDTSSGTHGRVPPASPPANARAPRTAPVGAKLSPEIASYMDKEEADLRARLLAAGVTVARLQNRIVITMESDTTFSAAGDKVQPQFYQVLASVGEVLTRYDRTSIEVLGHIDSAAAGERGQTLSRRQAGAVAAVLQQHGVAPARIKAEGVGKAKPVASNATSAGRAKNRRVEIQVIPPAS